MPFGSQSFVTHWVLARPDGDLNFLAPPLLVGNAPHCLGHERYKWHFRWPAASA